MITPYFTILGQQIPIYGVCFFAGILIAGILALLICQRKGIAWFDIAYSAVYVLIGAIAGAKLLFLAVSLPQIIEEQIPFEAVLKGGFVFYGGLLGAILGLLIYCKQYKISIKELSESYAAVLPLGHAFGRVGCFFAGCCYGIPYDGIFSHTYHMSPGNTPLGVSLLPIQLIEAVGLLIIFAVEITVFFRTKSKTGYTVPIYLATYPVLRFVLEFFRGDTERGKLGPFSTSQCVSLAILFGFLFYLINKKTKSRKHI